jgi:hypothetical protein
VKIEKGEDANVLDAAAKVREHIREYIRIKKEYTTTENVTICV